MAGYDTDHTIVWVDSLGVTHVERFATASILIVRAEELEEQGAKVIL